MRALVALAVLAVILAVSVADAHIYTKYYRSGFTLNSTLAAASCSGAYSYYTRIPTLCGRWYSSETGTSTSKYYQEFSCGFSTAVYDLCTGDTCASSTCTRYTVDTNVCTSSTADSAYYTRTCTLSAGSVAATLVGAAAVVLATLF